MIYIYRRAGSDGAVLLAQALNGVRTRAFNPRKRRTPQDVVVCWGEADPQVPGIQRVLNGSPIRSKFEDAIKLKEAGVPTVEVSRTQPRVEVVPHQMEINARVLNRKEAKALKQAIEQFLAQPERTPDVWLPRNFSHVGGNDLLNPPARPDYFSKKEKLVQEFRIHCFKGKSIKAGEKVKREDTVIPHEWVRSYDGGWRIKYDGFKSNKAMRELAAKSLEALSLDFGAVDIGRKADGSYIVLEVNRAPGIEGNSVQVYANAVKEWAEAQPAR